MNPLNSKPRPTWASCFFTAFLFVMFSGGIALGRSDDIFDAINDGDVQTVTKILDDNPDVVSTRDHDGVMPLEYAAIDGRLDMVRLLLDKKADVNAKESRAGTTAIFTAVLNNHKDITELLLSHNADVNAANNNGETPLYLAAENGYKEVAELLLANKANTKCSDYVGDTALHKAAFKGHGDMVKLLLANKADVNAKNKDGDTPLTYIISRVDAVISFGANYGVNGTTQQKSGNDSVGIAAILIDGGADVNTTNKSGMTPLQLASQRRNTQMVELLKNHGAK